MAISLVGASIIWRFVYDYSETDAGTDRHRQRDPQGPRPRHLLVPAQRQPWNTIFLIVIMIWVQAGFAMTILAASIRAIPDDIIEAARLDGVGGLRMFRYITSRASGRR